MPLFTTKRSYLGVDIGSASIKLVELSRTSGQAQLETYGLAELPVSEVQFGLQEKITRTAQTIARIVTQSRARSRKAVAALPTYSVFSSVLTLPAMDRQELDKAIPYEAKKVLPLPPDEMNIDYKELHDQAGAAAEVGFRREHLSRILLTAAPKNLVSQYLEIFRAAGLELISLETEAFALARAFLGFDPAPAMVVDVGALTTDFMIIERQVPVLNRSIDVGGLTVTRAIAHSLNITERRAEQFKRDVGVTVGGSATSGIPKTIETTLSPLVNEMKYTLSLYQAQGAAVVDKVVLTGGSAFLPGLASYLESLFQVRVIVGNPWAGVSYQQELKPILEEAGPRFGTAIGLALRLAKPELNR